MHTLRALLEREIALPKSLIILALTVAIQILMFLLWLLFRALGWNMANAQLYMFIALCFLLQSPMVVIFTLGYFEGRYKKLPARRFIDQVW